MSMKKNGKGKDAFSKNASFLFLGTAGKISVVGRKGEDHGRNLYNI